METINERMGKIRKTLKYNQADFANELGVSRSHISNMEKGNDNPSMPLLKLICIKFRINEDWMINGKGEPFLTIRDWDSHTDEGLKSRYSATSEVFENIMAERSESDLLNTIEAFSYLTSLLSGAKLSNENKAVYLSSIREIVDELEKLIFSTSTIMLLSKDNEKPDSRQLLELKIALEEKIENITKAITSAINAYLLEFRSDYRF